MITKLNKWDLELIHLFKQSDNFTWQDIASIWATRNGIQPYQVSFEAITLHLLQIYQFLDKNFDLVRFIEDLSPDNTWKFPNILSSSDPTKDHYNRCLHVLISRLTFLEVKDIPGYQEYINQLSIK